MGKTTDPIVESAPKRKRSRAMSQLITDFDEVFQSIGGAGTFQYCLFALLGLNAILGTEIIWFNFIAYKMDHFCGIEELGMYEMMTHPYGMK